MDPSTESVKPKPEDTLDAEEMELLQRARRREIACPWCDRALAGEFVTYDLGDDVTAGVRLSCRCGFVEY